MATHAFSSNDQVEVPRSIVRKISFIQPEQWTQYRSKIACLYLEEGLTLHELMLHMKTEEGVRATVNMYKKRITAWGLDKKYKTRKRQSATERVSVEEALDQTTASDATARGTDRGIVSRTHRRRPRVSEREYFPPGHEIGLASTSFSRSISLPDSLRVPEAILQNMSEHIQGSFGRGLWWGIDDDDAGLGVSYRSNMQAITTWYAHTCVGVHHFHRGRHDEGKRLFKMASLYMQAAFAAPGPFTQILFVELLNELYCTCREPRLVLTITHQAAHLVATSDDSSARMVKNMVKMEPGQLKDLHLSLLLLQVDLLEAILGRSNLVSIKWRLLWVGKTQDIARADRLLTQMGLETDRANGHYCRRSLIVIEARYMFYYARHRFAEAISLCFEALHRMEVMQWLDYVCWERCNASEYNALEYLAWSYRCTDQYALAESTVMQLVDLLENRGVQSGLFLRALNYLKMWVEEDGNLEKMAEIQNRQEDIIAREFSRLSLS